MGIFVPCLDTYLQKKVLIHVAESSLSTHSIHHGLSLLFIASSLLYGASAFYNFFFDKKSLKKNNR